MSDYITVPEVPFKRFVFMAYKEDFAAFAKRYFNFEEDLTNELFHLVVHDYYLKVKVGEMQLGEKTNRQLMTVGTKVLMNFLRNQPRDLTEEGI